MNDFFRFDTDEERRALLIRARKVALSAIQKYNLEWDNIQFIQLSDTITYKIETSTDNNYLLRIHSDRLSREEIRSELLLLQALNKSKDLNVPEGMANCDGIYVLDIETEIGYRRPYVTMMRWIEGEKAVGEFTDNQAYNMGVLMSRLHAAAKDFNPPSDFVRPTWGVESFKREMAKLERYYERFYPKRGGSCIKMQLRRLYPNLPRCIQVNITMGSFMLIYIPVIWFLEIINPIRLILEDVGTDIISMIWQVPYWSFGQNIDGCLSKVMRVLGSWKRTIFGIWNVFLSCS